jgi:hypothetical protein
MSLKQMLAWGTILLVLAWAGAFLISFVLVEWRDTGDAVSNHAGDPSPKDVAEESFSITRLVGPVSSSALIEDLGYIARRMAPYLPDFACTEESDEQSRMVVLNCDGDWAGFQCALDGAGSQLVCREGLRPLGGLPACTVASEEEGSLTHYLVQCSGPNTDASCELSLDTEQSLAATLAVTCERV